MYVEIKFISQVSSSPLLCECDYQRTIGGKEVFKSSLSRAESCVHLLSPMRWLVTTWFGRPASWQRRQKPFCFLKELWLVADVNWFWRGCPLFWLFPLKGFCPLWGYLLYWFLVKGWIAPTLVSSCSFSWASAVETCAMCRVASFVLMSFIIYYIINIRAGGWCGRVLLSW